MKRLTKEQAAIIGAYTGFLAGPFGDMHEYIEKIMGRPIWTHDSPEEQQHSALEARDNEEDA